MTSQLVLGNGHGIALASDSAVTMGRRRTFETSEKIIPLPMPHRVAVMHAGSVMFHGLPYGTILNEWIQSLGDVQLRSVELYKENFISWLSDGYRKWTTETVLLSDLREGIIAEFVRISRGMEPDFNKTDPAAVLAVWEAETREVMSFPIRNALREEHAKVLVERALRGNWDGSDIQSAFDYWFVDVVLNEEILSAVHRFMIASLQRCYPGSFASRGVLTFIGFGSTEMLPTVARINCFGVVPSHASTQAANPEHLYLYDGDIQQAERGSTNGVYLIHLTGQTAAIELIFEGFDRNLIGSTTAAVREALAKKVPRPTDGGNNSVEEPELGSLIQESIERSFIEYSESSKLESLRRTIAGMPLATLAGTAKSLIEVQRLSLEIAGELQTVGGQVDVATITLKDGFQWIRQKEHGDFMD